MSKCKCRSAISSGDAPKPIGPYSVGIKAGSLIFTAGQLGIDPASGNLVSGGVEAETYQALENLSAILRSAGSNMEHIVKTTVFLLDMADFSTMNNIYAKYFLKDPPARSAVQVAALPKGGRVEIEAIAFQCDCPEENGCCCKSEQAQEN